jgi:pimeloyl-ACP methyl ester carboxylesterase
LLALCGLLILAAAIGATHQWIATRRDLAATPPPGRLVDIGGHRLHLWCSGAGSPAVVLESGLGGASFDWGYVQPAVAAFTKVCSYDRAGMGYSDPGPFPRTTRRVAEELAHLVDRARMNEPLILVGASIGGLMVRLFASEREQRVAGLVLVDASHEDQTMDLPAIAPFVPILSSLGVFRMLDVSFGPELDALAPSVQRFARATAFRASTYQAAASEGMSLPTSAAQVKASRRKLSIPVIVITAGRGSDDRWRELQRDQVGLSSQACQMFAEQSGHAIPLRQPDAVVKASRAVVLRSRGRSDIALCE